MDDAEIFDLAESVGGEDIRAREPTEFTISCQFYANAEITVKTTDTKEEVIEKVYSAKFYEELAKSARRRGLRMTSVPPKVTERK